MINKRLYMLQKRSWKSAKERYYKEERGMLRLNNRITDYDGEIRTELYYYITGQIRGISPTQIYTGEPW